jgi:hypothetical protein
MLRFTPDTNSGNLREFNRVEGLRWEDWLGEASAPRTEE